MRRELIGDIVGHAAGDIMIVEGVMGLFDGAAEEGQCGRGSTADLAALTGWPVVLVLDVSGQAETAAAVALGCAHYRDDIRLAGVILNRVASAHQESLIVPAIERAGLPVLGCLARREALMLAERHLGLVQASETADLELRLEALAEAVDVGIRVDALLAAASPASINLDCPEAGADGTCTPSLAPPGQRIALAEDAAFSFVYPHLVAGWRAAGATPWPGCSVSRPRLGAASSVSATGARASSRRRHWGPPARAFSVMSSTTPRCWRPTTIRSSRLWVRSGRPCPSRGRGAARSRAPFYMSSIGRADGHREQLGAAPLRRRVRRRIPRSRAVAARRAPLSPRPCRSRSRARSHRSRGPRPVG